MMPPVSLAAFFAVRSRATERFRVLTLPWAFVLIATYSLQPGLLHRGGRREITKATPVPTRHPRVARYGSAIASKRRERGRLLTRRTDMPGKRKATAKRFGILESTRKKGVKDLAAAKGRAARGGAVSAAGLKGVVGVHGCPACPHPAVLNTGS